MNLIKKTIEFHNDDITAIKVNDKIYIGVNQICKNIGMNKAITDRQIQKVRFDFLLLEGCFKFKAGVFDLNNSTIGLDITYLPIWLAKISITPKMFNENNELARKLIDYQLHAKDVLADYFLNENAPDRKLFELKEQLKNSMLAISDYYKEKMTFAGKEASYYKNLTEYVR